MSTNKTRTYRIINEHKNDGIPCPSELIQHETCVLSEWSNWDTCDCTNIKSKRVRKILKNGLKCNHLTEVKDCIINV